MRAQQGAGPSSAPTESRKRDIDRTLATTRTSTASMGRFDKKLEGEKKLKGVKRKVCCQVFGLNSSSLTFSRSSKARRSLRRRKNHKTCPSCQNWTASLRQRSRRAATECSTCGKPCVRRARARAAPHWRRALVAARARRVSGKSYAFPVSYLARMSIFPLFALHASGCCHFNGCATG